MNLSAMTALEVGHHIQAGDLSVCEVTQDALERSHALQSSHNIFLTLCEEQALERASALQKGLPASPLAGVPMTLKDNLCSKGVRTTCASRMLANFIPPYDATAVKRLHQAGSILLGKTNLDEFAMGSSTASSVIGPTRNPWDASRVPGGSSGGSAAAVALGLGWYSLGSDTGGSVRLPASYCGVTGIKPTYGDISRYGLVAYASSLDQIGVLARSAADCAAVLDQVMGKDPLDATSADHPAGTFLSDLALPLKDIRVGLPQVFFTDALSPEVRNGILLFADHLRDQGAVVEEFTLPGLNHASAAYSVTAATEASSNLARFSGGGYPSRNEGFGAEVKRRILFGTLLLSNEECARYVSAAKQQREAIRASFQTAFQRFDLLLLPTTSTAAPKVGEPLSPEQASLTDLCTICANLAGLPALSLPTGFTAEGLPMSAQLMAAPFREDLLLRAAHSFQCATSFHRAMPGGDEM